MWSINGGLAAMTGQALSPLMFSVALFGVPSPAHGMDALMLPALYVGLRWLLGGGHPVDQGSTKGSPNPRLGNFCKAQAS